MAREELPGGIALVSIPVALLGFVATGALVSIATLATDALPRLIAAALGFAIALTLVLVGYVVTTGELSPGLLVAVLAGWGLTLVGLSRVTPQTPLHP